MEPKREGRRKLLKYPLILGAGILIGKLSSPCPSVAEINCPPETPTPLPKRDLSQRFGVQIPGDGAYDLSKVMDTGAGWIRFVAMQEDKTDPVKMLDFLDRCRKSGIKTLAVVASESLGTKSVGDAARYFAKTYDGAIDAWQIGNEPDDINPEGRWSWKLDPGNFANLLWIFRDAMGPNAYLVSGGLDTNRLEYLQQVGYEGLRWVNGVAIHPYGQGLPDWPSPYGFPDHVGMMVNKYFKFVNQFGKKIWITEWGIQHEHFGYDFAAEYVRRMMSYFRDSDQMNFQVEKFFYFNLFDKAHPEFSLIGSDGVKRPSYFAYRDTVLGNKTSSYWLGDLPPVSKLSPFPL